MKGIIFVIIIIFLENVIAENETIEEVLKIPDCNLSLGESGVYFPFTDEKLNFDVSLPIKQVDIGSLECKWLNPLKWFFLMEYSMDNIIIKGIRAYIVILLILFIIASYLLFRKIKVEYKPK